MLIINNSDVVDVVDAVDVVDGVDVVIMDVVVDELNDVMEI